MRLDQRVELSEDSYGQYFKVLYVCYFIPRLLSSFAVGVLLDYCSDKQL
ncbi:Protein of unknown function [Pyronema omphalodes CBS 100304]|uniref:Uncharacterized protein n=1 Tax=Pyronema omphalodes (strain CBS 100304) TaxID=1076935 RepID=U4LN54_PYROM|nr:Protein of unknown function [Pyronema omphalodes CBS 100304]